MSHFKWKRCIFQTIPILSMLVTHSTSDIPLYFLLHFFWDTLYRGKQFCMLLMFGTELIFICRFVPSFSWPPDLRLCGEGGVSSFIVNFILFLLCFNYFKSCNHQFFSELITTQLRDFHMVSPQVVFTLHILTWAHSVCCLTLIVAKFVVALV